jgi:hypothetical protein
MRRVLTTVLAVALLLGLGALAVLALPNANASLAGAPLSAAAPDFEPEAPLATNNYNAIGMPLNAANQFTSAGFGFDSDGLASLVGSSVSQVLQWNNTRQEFDTWNPVSNTGVVNGLFTTTPFALAVGGSYWLLVDSTSPTVVSFVGDVPAQNSVKFTLVGPVSGCSYNALTIPLEQSSLTNSDLLADSINAAGQVSQVLQWNAVRQEFDTWNPVSNTGVVNGLFTTTPFATKIGYPYMICGAAAVNGQVWP